MLIETGHFFVKNWHARRYLEKFVVVVLADELVAQFLSWNFLSRNFNNNWLALLGFWIWVTEIPHQATVMSVYTWNNTIIWAIISQADDFEELKFNWKQNPNMKRQRKESTLLYHTQTWLECTCFIFNWNNNALLLRDPLHSY